MLFFLSLALSGTGSKSLGTLEADLQHVLMQKIEDVLQVDLQSLEKVSVEMLPCAV